MPSKQKEEGMDNNKKGLLESFLAHRNQLFRLIGRIVRPDEIEDIVQETFVQSYAAARHQQIHNPRNFMFRTARNLALNSINRSEHKLSSSIEEMEDFDISSDVDLVEEGYQSEQKFLSFCKAVSTLPVVCRKVFILKKVYGLSQKEIASFLDIAPSTVEKHISRGMNVTSDYMSSAGYTNIVNRSKRPTKHAIHGTREKEHTT
jgi:RNA polymerase sigma factor (sigma-70 family)